MSIKQRIKRLLIPRKKSTQLRRKFRYAQTYQELRKPEMNRYPI